MALGLFFIFLFMLKDSFTACEQGRLHQLPGAAPWCPWEASRGSQSQRLSEGRDGGRGDHGVFTGSWSGAGMYSWNLICKNQFRSDYRLKKSLNIKFFSPATFMMLK